MKVLIWGAGAIGGTIGAFLVNAGHDVTFVDRVPEHVKVIRSTGLKITGPISQLSVVAPAYTPNQLSGEWECVVLAVKAQDTREATQALAPFLSDSGYVISAQNGLNELTIKEIVGAARTIGCFVNFGADYIEPGVIMYGGRGAVVLGELDGQITPRLEALHQVFLAFDDRAIITPNIWGYLWGKLGYGAQLFATALTNESIADALANPAYYDVFIELAREVIRVAQALGIQVEGFNGYDPHAFAPGVSREHSIRSIEEMVAFNRRSAKSHSGVWRDLAVRKRRTEIDEQIAPVVRLGAEVGVACPLTARLVELIHEIEDGKRPQQLENLDELKALLVGSEGKA